MLQEIIKRTLRVPVNYFNDDDGDSTPIVTSLDSLLISNGFKLSPQLAAAMSSMDKNSCTNLSRNILDAIKELIGAHVKHNVYFKKFPANVPNTDEFWCECILDALCNRESAEEIMVQLSEEYVNLLDLPKYGKYLHSYEDMVAVHEVFISHVNRKIKVLQIGGNYDEELTRLYHSLAGSSIPLSESDRNLLSQLSEMCIESEQPKSIPMRENRALINTARIKANAPIIVDTVTDVLRLACHLSDGDVTLAENTKFKSFPRSYRRIILSALDSIAVNSPEKLADVNIYCEQWKRLFERLHPWEYKQFKGAHTVHEAAMGVKKVRSLTSKIEASLNANDISKALSLFKSAPGLFYRNIDRLLRLSLQYTNVPKSKYLYNSENLDLVIAAISDTAKDVPARILFGIREHLQNRVSADSNRIFTNTKGKSWVTKDNRQRFSFSILDRISAIIDEELISRLPELPKLIVDPDILKVALPKSNKGSESGLAVMPRGSKSLVCPNGELLRFFMYWRQANHTTDYDLSTLFLDENFVETGHASYTDIRGDGYTHSGDITAARNGASEFIDIDLSKVKAHYIVPQVNVYSGEGFDEVQESFFGFMERDPNEKGLPYEPTTVCNKSDIRGVGKVALPLVFAKTPAGWFAFWMQMYLKGTPHFNRVEENKVNTTLLARAIVTHSYLDVMDVLNLLVEKTREKLSYTDECDPSKEDQPVIFVGMNAPEALPEGSMVYTLSNLHELVNLFDKA